MLLKIVLLRFLETLELKTNVFKTFKLAYLKILKTNLLFKIKDVYYIF